MLVWLQAMCILVRLQIRCWYRCRRCVSWYGCAFVAGIVAGDVTGTVAHSLLLLAERYVGRTGEGGAKRRVRQYYAVSWATSREETDGITVPMFPSTQTQLSSLQMHQLSPSEDDTLPFRNFMQQEHSDLEPLYSAPSQLGQKPQQASKITPASPDQTKLSICT